MMNIKSGCFYSLQVYKTSAGSVVNMQANNKIKQNQRPLDLATHQLAEELHKLIIKKI